jgi:hypothetical protein
METYKGKAGRTLLVKKDDTSSIDNITFDGLESSTKTPSGSTFLTFKSPDSAKDAFELIKNSGAKAKYPLYRIFFKISPKVSEDKGKDFIRNKLDELTTEKTYDDLKEQIIKKITENCDKVNVMYFKLYRKQGKLTGPGDLSLDRKEDLDTLVELRTINIYPEYDVQLFRFNVNSNVNSNIHNNTRDNTRDNTRGTRDNGDNSNFVKRQYHRQNSQRKPQRN